MYKVIIENNGVVNKVSTRAFINKEEAVVYGKSKILELFDYYLFNAKFKGFNCEFISNNFYTVKKTKYNAEFNVYDANNNLINHYTINVI